MHFPKFAFAVLLAALLVAQVSGQPITNCPRPVNCVHDPCEGARCPRFLNTGCRPDFCNGECKATFFRLSDGKEVTDRCSAETCGEKVCQGSRTCIEEVVPPSCPAGSPNCRQYIKARCVLPPPVMNCSFVACHPETVCVVKDTPRGPRPRCVAPPPPSSCDELECEEGMECFERKREGLRSVVRCVPASISEKPRNCSELECPDGFVCMVTNNRAICAMAPTPRTCSELECEPGQECREVTSNTSSSSTPLCITVIVIGSTCEELKCEELLGQECTTLTIEDLSTPIIFLATFCAPTANCSLLETRCQQRGQICEVKGEGDSAVARCVQPTTCEKVLCNPGFECVAFMFNSTKCPATVGPGIPMPMLPQPSLDLNFVLCFPSVIRSSCKELNCRDDQGCAFSGYPARNVSLAYCFDQPIVVPSPQPTITPFPQPTCNNTNPCFGGMEICVDLKQGNIQLDTSCVTINCLENNTICDPGFTCRSLPGEFEGTADFDSVCTEDASNFEFGGSCEERECDEGQMCYDVEFEGELVGTICVPRQQPTPSPQPTCNDTNPCFGGMEICVDLKEDNIQLDTSCVTINCLENNTICDPGFTCRSLPGEFEGTADFDSVCTEDASNFEFGGGCKERECDEGHMCYEVEFEGELVGTICIPRQQPTPSPQPTCNDTNPCFGGMEICVDLKEDNIQLDTSCVTINCLENNTICDPGFTCRSLPGEFEGTADFDSVCTEDASNFEFGGGCKERECDEGHMCYEVEFEGELVGTICIPRQQPTPSPQPTCNDTNPCFGGMEICVDLKQDNIQLDTSCVTINCLENNTICDPGFTCRSLPGEFEGTADFDSVCTEDASNFEFGGSCEERECDEGQMCYEVEFEGELVGTICIPRQQPTPSPQPTCNDTNPCFGGMEICVDLKEDNIQLDTSCVTINCLGNNTICDPGFTCHSLPGEFEGTADFDSVCTEDASNFEFGGSCEERECNEGQMCQNVEFERTLVGTVCIPRQRPPKLGCRGLNCREGEECAIFRFGNSPPTAGCVCSALVTQSLEPIDIPLSTLCDDVDCDEDMECQVIVKEASFPLVAPVCVPTGLNVPDEGKRV